MTTEEAQDLFVRLSNRLSINKYELDTASEEQAELYENVCEAVAAFGLEADKMKYAVECLELDLCAQARAELQDLAAKGEIKESKITEGAIRERAYQNAKLRSIKQELIQLQYQHDRFIMLKRAYEQRTNCVSDLVKLYCSNYFVSSR